MSVFSAGRFGVVVSSAGRSSVADGFLGALCCGKLLFFDGVISVREHAYFPTNEAMTRAASIPMRILGLRSGISANGSGSCGLSGDIGEQL